MVNNRDGEPKQVIQLQQEVTSLREFLEYAAAIILEFVLHNHNDVW